MKRGPTYRAPFGSVYAPGTITGSSNAFSKGADGGLGRRLVCASNSEIVRRDVDITKISKQDGCTYTYNTHTRQRQTPHQMPAIATGEVVLVEEITIENIPSSSTLEARVVRVINPHWTVRLVGWLRLLVPIVLISIAVCIFILVFVVDSFTKPTVHLPPPPHTPRPPPRRRIVSLNEPLG